MHTVQRSSALGVQHFVALVSFPPPKFARPACRLIA